METELLLGGYSTLTPLDHISSKDCWCHPTPNRDPVSGRTAYVHHKPS